MDESSENLEDMKENQLREVIKRAQERLQELARERLEELRRVAKEAGYEVTLTRIGEDKGKSGKRRSATRGQEERGTDRRGKVQAKYRNPDNHAETWTGRGRQPKWVQMALAHDQTLEDLAISAGG